MFHDVAFDVFEEAFDNQDGVMGAELLAPEFLQIVAPGVVETGELPVNECGLAGGATVVARGGEQILRPLLDDPSRIDEGENSVVFYVGFGTAQSAQFR